MRNARKSTKSAASGNARYHGNHCYWRVSELILGFFFNNHLIFFDIMKV